MLPDCEPPRYMLVSPISHEAASLLLAVIIRAGIKIRSGSETAAHSRAGFPTASRAATWRAGFGTALLWTAHRAKAATGFETATHRAGFRSTPFAMPPRAGFRALS